MSDILMLKFELPTLTNCYVNDKIDSCTFGIFVRVDGMYRARDEKYIIRAIGSRRE